MTIFIESVAEVRAAFAQEGGDLRLVSCSSWKTSGPCLPTKSLKPPGYLRKKVSLPHAEIKPL